VRFNDEQITRLRKEWDQVDTIDPDSMIYRMLLDWLDASDQELLYQLSQARIKFVSSLARNRVRGERVSY
jgi:hypothetical protein